MIRRPPRSTPLYSSAASDVYKRQVIWLLEDDDSLINLFRLHSVHENAFFPCIYSYENVTQNTRNRYAGFWNGECQRSPGSIPRNRRQGLFFHFGQCLWRKIQELGLTRLYGDSEEVRDFLRWEHNFFSKSQLIIFFVLFIAWFPTVRTELF